ncbi:AI-2E family transporter [Candidatus Igneacidithiobacillus taiwanensis]|uniref:AI-2E family transporter n=1 Tax=Candidatus Igneacidithiobacillus taiwanensis TaxID=1945924 RepID=UPI00289F3D3C|nr:AI-2E family transporter [Candidatus Igneacidithiobacillus taiwanensis]
MRIADLAVRDLLRIGAVAALLGFFAYLLWQVLAPFLGVLAWTSIIVYVSWPLRRRICRYLPPWPGAILLTLLFSLLLLLPFFFLSLHLYYEVEALLHNWSQQDWHWHPLRQLQQIPWLAGVLQQLPPDWRNLVQPGALSPDLNLWAGRVSSFAGSLGKLAGTLGLIWVSSLIFYRHGDTFLAQLARVGGALLGPSFPDYLRTVGNTLQAVVYGIFATAIAQGLLAGLGYWVSGIPAPVLLTFVTMLFSLIPFGTPLVWGAASIWLFWQEHYYAAAGLFLWGALVVSWVDNLIRPWVISSAVQLPFLLVLFGVLGGLLAFGFLGLFLGPVLLALALNLWRQYVASLPAA